MREINVKEAEERIYRACAKIAHIYAPDIRRALDRGYAQEEDERSVTAMKMLLENAEIAEKRQIPICQDTGLVTVYIHAGQEVHFVGGSLKEAVQNGVRRAYKDYYLRASVVDDPLFERVNTKDNTPAVIYCDITEGDQVEIEVTAKGFGSENMSAVAMLKPAQGIEGVKEFVLDTIRKAGPNACPPMIVGVGIGGTFDYSAVMAKRALLRSIEERSRDARYAALEEELIERANQLKIGPMGLHGKTTVLGIQIESAPTHIAGLPVAVNICCHACRHERMVL